MKNLKITTIALALFIFCFKTGVSINDNGNDNKEEKKTRPAQISLISPFGTNGLESGKIVNGFSLNMIAGYAGGLNGAEIGGFSNVLLGDMTGLQIAGFANTNTGKSKGLQISGFSNVNKSRFTGAQIAGFSNVVSDSASALQLAGFSNVTTGALTGSQIAGFTNYSNSSVTGAQISGFSNVAKGNSKYLQLAGFSNVSTGTFEGLQLSGFANVSSKEVKGVQISGFFNYAKKLNGFQLSFINVCDTVEKGIMLGFLSFAKNGYRQIEIGADESFYLQGDFKTGTKQFYNILSLGVKPHSGDIIWGFGYGIGTMFPLSEKLDMNIDAVSYHVNNDQWWTDNLNMLNKLKLNLSMKIGNHISVYGGPTWNVLIRDKSGKEHEYPQTPVMSWSVYERENINKTTKLNMYPGFTIGIRVL